MEAFFEGDRLRLALMRDAMDKLGADAAQFYQVGRFEDGSLRVRGVLGIAAPEALQLWEVADGIVVDVLGDTEFAAPANELALPLPGIYELPMWNAFFAPFGLVGMVHMNVVDGPFHIGFICLLSREKRWSPDAARSRAVAAELIHGIRRAHELDTQNAVPVGAAYVSEQGVEGDAAVQTWLTNPENRAWARATLERVRSRGARPAGMPVPAGLVAAPGCFVEVTPAGQGGTLRFVAATLLTFPPFLRLTALRRRIAAIAGTGATVAQIAHELDRSPETIREHLAVVYTELGIRSRAELTALWSNGFR